MMALILTLILASELLYAEEALGPMGALRKNIEEAVTILESDRYADDANQIQQCDRLCLLAREGFDFSTFIRLSLAYDLEKFTFEEVKEFTELFIQFLCRFYITQLQERYNSERILFQRQALLDETRAWVQIAILWRNMEIPVTVFMTRSNGTWKAYDVNVLGIGAVQNYRQQIHEILEEITPTGLISLVKQKLSESKP
jgi:ABC-type transporter MlaC component